MNNTTRTILSALVLGTTAAHAQLSAYLPAPGETVLSLGYQYQTYEDFWVGDTSVPLKLATGFKEQEQQTATITLERGLTDRIALDATFGWTWARFRGGPGPDLTDDGLTDTTFGVRYNLVKEEGWIPQLTFRAGGIIAGTYDDSFPFSAGDGAHGFEVSMLVGKKFCENAGYYGDIGYRWRDNDVPDDFFFSSGLWARFNAFTVSAGYRHTEGQSGGDIGGPGFGVTYGFPQVEEVQKQFEASLAYEDQGGRTYSIFYGHTLDGRNTGEKDIFGVSISIPFGPGEPAPEGKSVRGYSK